MTDKEQLSDQVKSRQAKLEETKQQQKCTLMSSVEEVKCLISEKEQVQAELATEKASKAIQEVQLQNIFKELHLKASVLQREVDTAQELVEEKELELEEWWLKNVSRIEVPRDLQMTVCKPQGTSEAVKKELSVLTKWEEELGKELQSGQGKAFQKEQLLLTQQQEMAGTQALIRELMPIKRLYQQQQVEQASLENQYKKGSTYPNVHFLFSQKTGPTSGRVEVVAPALLGVGM